MKKPSGPQDGQGPCGPGNEKEPSDSRGEPEEGGALSGFRRFFLRLYPQRLRKRHGPEMAVLLQRRLDRARASGGLPAVGREWGRAWGDLFLTRALEFLAPRGRETTEPRTGMAMNALFQDLRYALRRLARTPLFTGGALIIIAMAIGANTAAFTVVNHLLLTPPPFGDPDRVVNVYQDSDEGEPNSTSFPAYRDMATMGEVFGSVAATSPDNAVLEAGGETWSVAIEYTTASFMEVIDMAPSRGRWFDEEMDVPGAGSYAVVSHHTWTHRFGADPDMVGRVVQMNGHPVTVLGVGPADYNGMGGFMVTDFWLSISSVGIGGSFRVANLDRRQDHWYDVKARLAPGVTVARAQEAMDILAQRLAREFPDLNRGRDITVFPTREIRMHPQGDQEIFQPALLLMGVVALILVLASSNLGGLLLVRGVGRTQEVAVRRALGAAPGRVTRLFLGEALILSVLGGALGILLARWLLDLVAGLPLPLPFTGDLDLAMDVRVLFFTLALMTATGMFFGWAPAAQSLAADLTRSLKEDHRSQGGRRLSLFRNLMVAVQVAVSVVLVLASGLMVRSLMSYGRVDPGVDTGSVAVLRTDFSRLGLSEEDRGVILREIQEGLEAIPGVEAVAVGTRIPLYGNASTTTVVEGYEPSAGTGSVELDFAFVGPDYFRTLGMGLREGRTFDAHDQRAPDRVSVIVNQAAADRFWGGVDPLGRRIRPQADPEGWIHVIGVVSNVKVESLAESPRPMIYFALPETGTASPYVLVQTSGHPEALLPTIRSRLQAVNPRLPVVQLRTLASLVDESVSGPRMGATALGAFSLLALLLASLGIYTLVAFSVAGRRPEIGLRMALGAQGGRVVGGVMREMALTVALGMGAGGILSIFIFSRLQGLIYGAELLSLGTLLPTLGALLVTVALASWIPARRAARVDPVAALRGE